MKKKWYFLAFLSILLLGISIQMLHYFIWGYDTIFGADAYGYLSRVKATVIDDSHIFTYPGLSEQIQVYPPGFIILISSTMITTGVSDMYDLYMYTLIIQSLLIPFAIYVTTFKISKRWSVLSAFFALFIFGFRSSPIGDYVYYSPTINFISNSIQSIFLMIMFILLLIIYLHNKNNKFVALMFLVLFTLGISHITPFIGFSISLMGFIIIYSIISVIKHRKNDAAPALNFIVLIVPVMIIGLVLYLTYYYKIITPNLINFPFIEDIFDETIVQNRLILTIIGLFLVYGLIMGLRQKRMLDNEFLEKPNKRLIQGLIMILLGFHFIIVGYITLFKTSPIESRDYIAGLYPLYITLNFDNMKVIPFQIIGWIFFILSIFGLYYLLINTKFTVRFIGYIFFISLLISYIVILPLRNPLLFDLYLVNIFYPITLSTSVLIFFYSFNKSQVNYDNMNLIFKSEIISTSDYIRRKRPLNNIRNIKYFSFGMLSTIIASFIIINVLYSINNPPELREVDDINSQLYLLNQTIDPLVSYELLIYINSNTNNGEYVLADYHQELRAIYVTTHVSVTSLQYYDQDNNKHYGAEIAGALSDPHLLSEYRRNYNVRYVIITSHTNEEYKSSVDNNPTLYRVYSESNNQTIYI